MKIHGVSNTTPIGDLSTYGGYSYVAKTNNLNKQPSRNIPDWDLFVTGSGLKGDYDNATAYKTGDVVRVGGSTYLNIEDSTGNRPNVTYWNKLNEGLYWKGAWSNAVYYDKGDIVRGTINTDTSYICIQSNTHPNNVGPKTINPTTTHRGAGVDPVHTGNYYRGGPENDVITHKVIY